MSTEKIKIKDLLNYGEEELKELMREVIVDKSKELDWIDFNEKIFEYIYIYEESEPLLNTIIQKDSKFLCLPSSLYKIEDSEIYIDNYYGSTFSANLKEETPILIDGFYSSDLKFSKKHINDTRRELIIDEEREEGVISIDDFVVCYGIEKNDRKDIWIFDTPEMITGFFEYILKLLMKVIEKYNLNKESISSFFSKEKNEKLELADEEESKMKKMIKNVFE